MENCEIVSVAHDYVFDFERNCDLLYIRKYVKEIWHYSIYWSLFYVFLIYTIRYYMMNRRPFQLKAALITWNVFQAMINIFGVSRVLPEYLTTIYRYGFQRALCDDTLITLLGAFWLWVYFWAKLWDLCDTLFIVLRKRPLTVLHVIHHTVSLMIGWYFAMDEFSFMIFIGVVNATVHSLMYTYYTLKAIGFHLPKWVSIFMTIIQMIQMFTFTTLSIYIAIIRMLGQYCYASYMSCFLCSSATGVYFILFANFFYRTYFLKQKVARVPQCKTDIDKLN